MWILLGQIFSFLLLVATFVYIRSAGAVLRSALPRRYTADLGLLLTALLYVAPTTLIAASLYFALTRLGVIWISIFGIYVSWTQDLVYVVGILYYYLVLRRLRRSPASFEFVIRLREYAAWPSTEVVRKPLDYLLQRLPIGNRWKQSSVLIKPIDFQRFLGGDVRLLDEADPELLPVSYAQFCAVPHIPLPSTKEDNFDADETKTTDGLLPTLFPQLNWFRERKREFEDGPADNLQGRRLKRVKSDREQSQVEPNAPRYYLTNRALNCDLTVDLWQTSWEICRTLPRPIARTWKTFHFQESVRLRFVALFNTADLIERLLGAIVLCALRDNSVLSTGKIGDEEFRAPSSSSQWLHTLELGLSLSVNQLRTLHDALLLPRDDYQEWEDLLQPFAVVLGGAIVFSPNNRHTLAGLSALHVLRNKIIGHGGIGTHLRMQPGLYLSAIHHFFLSLMRPIIDLNICVYAALGIDDERRLADQGLAFQIRLDAGHQPFAALSDGTRTSLFPYLRYLEGRLLFFNRNTKEGTNYTDYNVQSVFEPSSITLATDWNNFIKPDSRDVSRGQEIL